LPEDSKYIEQFDRLRRWYQRLVPPGEGSAQPETIDSYRDDFYAFFVNCYHLKDWIKNDPSVPHLKGEVESFINRTESLSICADICNGLKHLKINGSRGGHNPRIHPEPHSRWEIGTDPNKRGIGFVISTESGEYDALQLAFDCMMNWEFFLAQNGEPT
jgi:hypothetical protein